MALMFIYMMAARHLTLDNLCQKTLWMSWHQQDSTLSTPSVPHILSSTLTSQVRLRCQMARRAAWQSLLKSFIRLSLRWRRRKSSCQRLEGTPGLMIGLAGGTVAVVGSLAIHPAFIIGVAAGIP